MNISKNVDQSMSLKTDDVEDAQLLERYNKLLRKVNTQKLILSVIKETKAEDIANVTEDERAKIDHALNFARAFEYMKLDDKGSNILGKLNAIILMFKSMLRCLFVFLSVRYKQRPT